MGTNTKEYGRAYYSRNSRKIQESNRRSAARIMAWFRAYKATLCCKQCGESHPACLHFHHIDTETKTASISELVFRKNCGRKRVEEELIKCIVLCANCHAKLHSGCYEESSTLAFNQENRVGSSPIAAPNFALEAQQAEHLSGTEKAAGSTPASGSICNCQKHTPFHRGRCIVCDGQ